MFDCGADGTMMGMMGPGGMMAGGGMMVFWILLTLALFALAVLGIWALIVWLRNNRTAASTSPQGGPNRAREALDERYARGDLSIEEYRERREALGG
ncbi:SHOCT domain-containing protein [Arthrobacter sp. UNC362MFTsu5.1]|uniref:SHOCT domain-containing protein n=1 Tax=Arthrobacter sp. UNC362MFTsu5.1 TaxID=1449044 RepID=UPI00068A5115|nr:SHOCT domain-containing protein [Arthrobacter sp. UNC362MFTsu5.1]